MRIEITNSDGKTILNKTIPGDNQALVDAITAALKAARQNLNPSQRAPSVDCSRTDGCVAWATSRVRADTMMDREKELERALKALVDMYVKNQDTQSEFIACITPKHADEMTALERRESEVWTAWDDARILLRRKG